MGSKKFYVVRKGRKKGIFNTWTECQEQVHKYKGAEFKSFFTLKEAETYLGREEVNIKDIKGLIIYVDGSYNRDLNLGGYGCIVTEKGQVLKKLGGKITIKNQKNAQNIYGEIHGSLKAMSWAKKNGYKKVNICYDFKGIKEWAERTWKAKSPIAQKYVREVKKHKKDIKVNFIKVKAHSGDTYNDMADKVAKRMVGV